MTGVDGGRTGWVRRLWTYLRRHRRDVALTFVAALLGSSSLAVLPLIARHIVDDVIVAHRSSLWPWLLLLIVAALAAFALSYLRRYHGGRAALAVQLDLRNAMHDHLQSMDLGTLGSMSTGQLVSRANSDSTLVQGLLMFLPIVTGNVLLMLLSLGIMLVLSPVLALVALVVVPALTLVSYRMRTKIFPAAWDAQQREGDVAQIVDEAVGGVRVVKAFGQEERELGRIVRAAGTLYGARMRTVRLQARYQPALESIPGLAQVAILAVGGWMTLHHTISIGTFLAFTTYVAQFAAPARQLAGMLTVAQQARAGVERIFQLLDLRPAILDLPDARSLPAAVAGEVTFDDVHFGYAGGPPVLRGFDLTIAPGERVALVGSSGSGKSTVAALLARLYDPDTGRVLVDGHDARGIRLGSLRGQLGVAFEDSFLFSDSVRANIAYGRPEATEAEISAAAEVAQADGFIRALPQGYDTPVGERGLTLSGGQRQRVALARAILADPRILVLDDATSAIDASTEEQIHHGLRQVLTGRTTLLIAHRVSTLHLADRVALVEEGRVSAEGTHDDLLAGNPAYRALLSGLDAETTAALSDQVEAYAAISSGRTTPEAWRVDESGADRPGARRASSGPPSLGPGLGGGGSKGGGGGGWRTNLAATPELLAQVAALRPVRDVPLLDLARESAPQQGFSLRQLTREFRRPLAIGLVLVVLDAVAGLFGPVLVRVGIDSGVTQGAVGVLMAASAVLLVVTPPTSSTRSARRSSPGAPPSRSCLRYGSGSGPSCSGSRWTTTSARWPGAS